MNPCQYLWTMLHFSIFCPVYYFKFVLRSMKQIGINNFFCHFGFHQICKSSKNFQFWGLPLFRRSYYSRVGYIEVSAVCMYIQNKQNWTKDGQNAALWSRDPKAKYTHMLLTDVAMHNNKTNDLLMLWMSWKSLFMRLWLSCILSCISQRHVLASEPLEPKR